VTWATKQTSEMPPLQLPPGRHRRSRRRQIGLVVLGLLLTSTVAAALVSPDLFGRAAGGRSTTATSGPTIARSSPGGPVTTSAVPTGGTATAVPAMAVLAAGVLTAVNAQRSTAHCPVLRLNKDLQVAAQAHSADMATNGYFDHIGTDGSDPGTRMRRAGYDPRYGWAENIAWGYTSVQAVMDGWLGSPKHRANILNCALHSTGIGVARANTGAIYWTEDFGGA
jgi:uncharacterized protein YkwD